MIVVELSNWVLFKLIPTGPMLIKSPIMFFDLLHKLVEDMLGMVWGPFDRTHVHLDLLNVQCVGFEELDEMGKK